MQRNFYKNDSSGRILVLTFAFSPFKIQMAPAIVKQMGALSQLGYSVDVLCADHTTFPILPIDHSLDDYIKKTFSNIYRLKNPPPIHAVKSKIQKLACYGDPMSKYQKPMFDMLMSLDFQKYDAIVTCSPFHSMNPVMVEVKKRNKNIFWIAYFGDPWARNPLELQKMRKFWDHIQERTALRYIDGLVHNSHYSLEYMLKNKPKNRTIPSAILQHGFTSELYPKRAKTVNLKTTFRYVGMLFGERSPEPLFKAFLKLFERRKDLIDKVKLEFVGRIVGAHSVEDHAVLKTPTCLSLPKEMISVIPPVSYVKSLELMYDADILLLIEAAVRRNLFSPSKVADYMGANTPIVGVVPHGSSEDICKYLGTWHAHPSDVDSISRKLEEAIDYCHSKNKKSWCNETYRKQFDSHVTAKSFVNFVNEIRCP